jgi:hypothetical protein
MRNPCVVRSGLAAVLAVSLVGLATACSSQVSGLDGTGFAGTSSGSPTTPGRPEDYTGILANHTGHVVILKSAQLLPINGFRLPRLIHEAVYTGLNIVSSARDWPPRGLRLPLKNFAGYRLLPSRKVMILYSVVAHRLGEYADAGIRVTVAVNGSQGKVDVVSYAGTCIVTALGHDCPESFYNRVNNAAERNS